MGGMGVLLLRRNPVTAVIKKILRMRMAVQIDSLNLKAVAMITLTVDVVVTEAAPHVGVTLIADPTFQISTIKATDRVITMVVHLMVEIEAVTAAERVAVNVADIGGHPAVAAMIVAVPTVKPTPPSPITGTSLSVHIILSKIAHQ